MTELSVSFCGDVALAEVPEPRGPPTSRPKRQR
jgi:hypothetical protein